MSYDKNILEFNQELNTLSSFAKGHSAKAELLNLHVLSDKAQIELLWDDLSAMLKMHVAYSSLPMSDDYEIMPLIDLMSKGHVCDLEEARRIKSFLDLTQSIRVYHQEIKKHIEDLSFFQTYPLPETPHLYETFEHIFDDQLLIRDDATKALYSIRKKLAVVDQRYVQSVQQSLKTYSSFLNEHLVVTRNDALCIAVNETYKTKVKGIVMDMSQSKQTIYIEPLQSKRIRDEKTELLQEEKLEIYNILSKLSQSILIHLDDIYIMIRTLKIYDMYQAKALYAKSLNAIRPKISTEEIHLIHARHPQLKDDVVPIHVQIKKSQQGLFITGPNTGGKTVSLKTVGLMHLLAQSGLFIPAQELSTVMIFDHIYADIGDSQSISQNLSTFSGHLTKHIAYLKEVNDNTLLLIDEIGSGTDPQEGVALAKALLNQYISKGAMLMVTTHYQALKEYALKQNMELASVSFDEKTLTPEYHIVMGVAGQSHAFDIASRLGLPQSVLHDAKHIYESSQSDAEKLLRALEKKEIALKNEKEIIDKQNMDLAIKIESYETHKRDFERYKDYAVQKAIEEKTKQLEEKIEKVEQMLYSIKNSGTSLPLTSKIKGQLKSINNEKITKNITFEIGEFVHIDSYDQVGTIISKKGDRYDVQLGHFKMTFTKDDLSKTQQKIEKPLPKNSAQDRVPKKTFVYELDLRGFRFEEVKPALEKAIDQALLSNQESLRVIHGFGTGAVRKAVYQFIKGHPNIKSHRFGKEGEGLNGVTVLTLK